MLNGDEMPMVVAPIVRWYKHIPTNCSTPYLTGSNRPLTLVDRKSPLLGVALYGTLYLPNGRNQRGE